MEKEHISREEALELLRNFLTLHTPYSAALPTSPNLSQHEVTAALSRRGEPRWGHADFEDLLYTLGCAGYGGLTPQEVKERLEKAAARWKGPRTLDP